MFKATLYMSIYQSLYLHTYVTAQIYPFSFFFYKQSSGYEFHIITIRVKCQNFHRGAQHENYY